MVPRKKEFIGTFVEVPIFIAKNPINVNLNSIFLFSRLANPSNAPFDGRLHRCHSPMMTAVG